MFDLAPALLEVIQQSDTIFGEIANKYMNTLGPLGLGAKRDLLPFPLVDCPAEGNELDEIGKALALGDSYDMNKFFAQRRCWLCLVIMGSIFGVRLG